jgi:pimeloyl-ACP methyl ester carboxylesterase
LVLGQAPTRAHLRSLCSSRYIPAVSALSQPGTERQGSAPGELSHDPPAPVAWQAIDWRAYQRWVVVDGTPIDAITIGPERAAAGQPLVFVHGLSGSWTNWLEQLPVFARDHLVIAIDLPGFGYSPMPGEKLSIAGYARILDRLLGQLEIDAAAIVGNSMGGFIAAELAIAVPERVERLVLVSAAGLSTHEPRGSTHGVPALRRLERVLMASGAWVASRSETVARRPRLRQAALSVVARHPGRLHAPLAAELLRGAGKPGFIQGLEAVLDYDIRERLGEIACPTLIVWGDRDRLIDVRDADVFAELIPNSRKVVFADTGHVAMLERPDEFNALLAGFLAE